VLDMGPSLPLALHFDNGTLTQTYQKSSTDGAAHHS
jgi:hypothetical protein